MRQNPALVAIYLTLLAIFVAITRLPGRIALTLVIVGFVSFTLSFLPAAESDSSDGGSTPESSPNTRRRWW
ncbi:MAG: hypothetical protein ACI8TL_001022 [Natronomonas sp.]|jgi:hypothetical protein